jgi:hypothetical protein
MSGNGFMWELVLDDLANSIADSLQFNSLKEEQLRIACRDLLLARSPAGLSIDIEASAPGLGSKEIDLKVTDPSLRAYWIELKYQRRPPGGNNAPLTQLRGRLVGDMVKLAAIRDDGQKMLLWLAENPIVDHMERQLPGLVRASVICPFRVTKDLIASGPDTFRREVRPELFETTFAVYPVAARRIPDASGLTQRFSGHTLLLFSISR